MDAYEEIKSSAKVKLVKDIPSQFWVDLRSLAIITYADTFAAVHADGGILIQQKLDELLQRRHFRMEKLLVDLAERHKLSHSMNLIVQNNRQHVYVFTH